MVRPARGSGAIPFQMTMNVRCVVFDIDDTLYLERDYVRGGFQAVNAWVEQTLHVVGFFDRAWQAFQGGTRGTLFDQVLPDLGVEPTQELIRSLVEVYRQHEPRIELLPDARSCLNRLHGRVYLAAVTDGPVESQRAKVQALGIASRVNQAILTAELGPEFGKPHPRAFEMIEKASGHNAAACVYVADNPAKDFQGPKSLGWRTVRVRRRQGLHHDVESGSDVGLQLSDLTRLADELDIR